MDDLFVLQRGLGKTIALWTQGDFTLDGKMDAADLDVLGSYWGTGVDASEGLAAFASVVPEPSVMMGGLTLLVLSRKRNHR